MTFRDSSLGGNFDSQRPHSGVEYSTFWGLATPSGDSFSRSEERAPKSGLPDFGTKRRIEIGNSRFRLRASRRMDARHGLAAILRDARFAASSEFVTLFDFSRFAGS